MDEATRLLIREKARAHNLLMEHREKPDVEAYRLKFTRARNHVRTVLRKKRRQHEKNIAAEAKTNPKKFFAHCQSKTKLRAAVAPLRRDPDDKDSLVNSDADKSEVLQAQYCSVFTAEDNAELPNFPKRSKSDVPRIVVDVDKVRKKLLSLDTSKSAGPDGIHPRLLRECADVLAEPLAALFQQSLDSGRVPSQWKRSVVSPIFKKGVRSLASNYRPVSLTAILCKMLESIIREVVVKHLLDNNLLTTKQFGFIKGRSTQLQLLTFLDEVFSSLDADPDGGAVDTIYLDYSKAFDTVPLRRLLHKLRAYGISGTLLDWMESFLVGRTQQVSVNGILSAEKPVLSGVPQGSVLGPVLFLLYINDIVDSLETNMLLFADDSKLFKHVSVNSAQEDCEAIQRDLARLEDWSNLWLLRFHPGKCHVLSLGRFMEAPCRAYDYKLCGQNLEHVLEERDLGVIIDCHMTFEAHIDNKINTANAFLGLIRRNFTFLDMDTLVRLYVAFVRPHIEYAQAVWSPSLGSQIKKLEAVQMRALKLVPELRDLPYEDQLRKAKLSTLAFRRLRGDMVDCYKHFHVYHREVLSQSFKPSIRKPNMLTQSSATPRFYGRIQELWNGLPPNVRVADNVNTFKNRLDKHWADLPLRFDYLAGTPTRLNIILYESRRSGR